MRFVVDIYYHDGDVSGLLTPEGGATQAFDGWLDLLRLLEEP
ncbi:hypothetical protein [Sphaerisporangium rhizosphaerae]|uniref:Uncharacterized protein n=1 Tax=Sphaerisporangium rhizosphaerae TaxID=2269375 RepID=A0ABW2PE43_9ACTN